MWWSTQEGRTTIYAENVAQTPTLDEYNKLPNQPVKFSLGKDAEGSWEILEGSIHDATSYINNGQGQIEAEKYQTMQQLKDIDVEALRKKLMALEEAVKENKIDSFKAIFKDTTEIPDLPPDVPQHIKNLITRLQTAQQIAKQLPNPAGAT